MACIQRNREFNPELCPLDCWECLDDYDPSDFEEELDYDTLFEFSESYRINE